MLITEDKISGLEHLKSDTVPFLMHNEKIFLQITCRGII